MSFDIRTLRLKASMKGLLSRAGRSREIRKGIAFITEDPYAAAAVGTGVRRKVLNHLMWRSMVGLPA